MVKCELHNIELRKSVKEYCQICEGYFSAHGLNNMRSCPFMFSKKNTINIDVGRAYPLTKGGNAHYIIKIFNQSLKFVPHKKLNKLFQLIFKEFQAFKKYITTFTGHILFNSCEKEMYSFYLFKKELYKDFKSKGKVENMIPLITEEWLFIPFSKEEFDKIDNNEKNALKNWMRIGVHNILDECFLDIDDKAICIDYKSYPRKEELNIKPIRSTDKKYQLITALMTFEYNTKMETKFVANIDLGTPNFPKITYYIPTSRGITYYKKALFKSYKHLIENDYPTKFNERSCINFCNLKLICPEEKIRYWRDFLYLNII